MPERLSPFGLTNRRITSTKPIASMKSDAGNKSMTAKVEGIGRSYQTELSAGVISRSYQNAHTRPVREPSTGVLQSPLT
jgi:hypothetical protein